MPQEFLAIDVETANANFASICQIGVVHFVGGQIAATWQSLVNPDDYFHPINVGIHGIHADQVLDAPSFPDVASELATLVNGKIVASHTRFDRIALGRASKKYGLPPPECAWVNTASVCQRTWAQFARKGYGLANVASWCGIEFRHHDALEDARATGLVLLRAMQDSGLDVEKWAHRSPCPIQAPRETIQEGLLAGEVVVFTGALMMPRREAADIATSAGCDVARSVGKKTTLLVVGDQDISVLAGHEKSSKHRKAEQLIIAGQQIRIVGESDFCALMGLE